MSKARWDLWTEPASHPASVLCVTDGHATTAGAAGCLASAFILSSGNESLLTPALITGVLSSGFLLAYTVKRTIETVPTADDTDWCVHVAPVCRGLQTCLSHIHVLLVHQPRCSSLTHAALLCMLAQGHFTWCLHAGLGPSHGLEPWPSFASSSYAYISKLYVLRCEAGSYCPSAPFSRSSQPGQPGTPLIQGVLLFQGPVRCPTCSQHCSPYLSVAARQELCTQWWCLCAALACKTAMPVAQAPG